MSSDKTKECKCICCGEIITVTKFASELSVKCDECKESNAEPDPQILEQIKQDREEKKKARVTETDPSTPSNKKKANCVKCGKEILIGKFASAKTCLCDECKGANITVHAVSKPKIDMGKLSEDMMPSLEQAYVIPQLINNRQLRKVKCPACGHEYMKIVKIIDSSPLQGLVIQYQCHEPDCLTYMTISEQAKHKLFASPMHKSFNYRAEEVCALENDIEDVRARNAIEYLLKLCNDNGIQVDGTSIPEYAKDYIVKENIGINPGWEDEIDEEE